VTEPPEVLSALQVQRDSAYRENVQLRARLRALSSHQVELLEWLVSEVELWQTARTTDDALAIADEIHTRAKTILAEAQRMSPQ